MTLGLIESQYLQDIADAVRNKTGEADELKPYELATVIRRDLVAPNGTKYITASDINPNTDNQLIDVKNYAKVGINPNNVGLIQANIKKGASIFGLSGNTPTVANSAGVCDVKIVNCLEGYDAVNEGKDVGGIYIDCTPNHKNYTESFYLKTDDVGRINSYHIHDIDGNNTGIYSYFKTETLLGLSTGSIIVIASTHAEMSAPYTSGGITPVYSYEWSQFFLVSGRGTIVIRD